MTLKNQCFPSETLNVARTSLNDIKRYAPKDGPHHLVSSDTFLERLNKPLQKQLHWKSHYMSARFHSVIDTIVCRNLYKYCLNWAKLFQFMKRLTQQLSSLGKQQLQAESDKCPKQREKNLSQRCEGDA